MPKQRRVRTKPASVRPSAARLGLFVILVLAAGAPLAYYSFVDPVLATVKVGSFQLFPLMILPGVLALFFGGARRMGWHPPGVSGALAAGTPFVIVGTTVGLGLLFGVAALSEGVRGGAVAELWGRSLLSSFATLLFPVLGEEMAWRGFLLRRLEPYGLVRAILLSSAVVTAYHAYAVLAPGLRGAGPAAAASFLGSVFLLEIVAGILYSATGSLWASFLFHLLWNATNPLFTGDIYFGGAGVFEGTLWVVNGEGALGALASLLWLPALWFAARTLRLRAAARAAPVPRRAATAWGSFLLCAVVGGAVMAHQPVRTDLKGDTKPPARTALRDKARAALDRALGYLDKNVDELTVDVVFLLRLIDGALPGTRAAAIAERGMPAAKRDPTYPLFTDILRGARPPHTTRALPPLPPFGPPDIAQPLDQTFSDTCLNGALECRWAPGCREYKTQRKQWGYVLSHQVLFFVFAKEKKCPWDVDIDRSIEELSQAMFHEAKSNPRYTDLFAERIGLGAYAGYREFLQDAWIEETVRAQHDDGCWQFGLDDDSCNGHSTGMGAWVLALYLGGGTPRSLSR
jgi:membrane protease YdiL (CAAX protease family)